jgi:large subunit ribosomal protein L7Ae
VLSENFVPFKIGFVSFGRLMFMCIAATELFKILNKYRPETKEQKQERLKAAAESKEAKAADPKAKKPLFVKSGINHIATLVEQKKASLVVISHDVDPIEIVVWLPALCRKMDVPYCIVKGKARLGQVVHKKTATALAFTGVRKEVRNTPDSVCPILLEVENYPNGCCRIFRTVDMITPHHPPTCRGLRSIAVQDEGSYSKLVESIKSNFNDRYDDFKKWGGGIMGAKSQERTRQKEKAVAREAAKRLQA